MKTIKLDKNAARQVFENAIRTQVQMVLESSSWGECTINGFLISGDDTTLLMEMTGHPAIPTSSLIGVSCEAQMYADQEYLFMSAITATPKWGQSRSIALARPNDVRVLDRRRSARAKLAPSSVVRLEWTHDGLVRRYTATMLNVSPDGLACRIEGPVTQAIGIGDLLALRFQLPYGAHAYELEAHVQNATPTAEGRTILGLQFVRSRRFTENLDLLSRALFGKPLPIRTEVFA